MCVKCFIDLNFLADQYRVTGSVKEDDGFPLDDLSVAAGICHRGKKICQNTL